MIKALLYLQCIEARNRLVQMLKQFKRPVYVIGLIIIGSYFYFFLIRKLFRYNVSLKESLPSWGWPSDPHLAESLGAWFCW